MALDGWELKGRVNQSHRAHPHRSGWLPLSAGAVSQQPREARDDAPNMWSPARPPCRHGVIKGRLRCWEGMIGRRF